MNDNISFAAEKFENKKNRDLMAPWNKSLVVASKLWRLVNWVSTFKVIAAQFTKTDIYESSEKMKILI